MSFYESNVCEIEQPAVLNQPYTLTSAISETTRVYRLFLLFYFTNRNTQLLKSLFAEDVTNIGSGKDEIAYGIDDVMMIFNRDKHQCPSEIEYKQTDLNIIPLNSHTGLAIGQFNLKTTINNIPVELPNYRITMVVSKIDNEWLIRHLHFSKGETALIDGESFPLTDIASKSFDIKDLFLANISHEIRTPVSGIIGMTEILKRSELSSEQQSYLEVIKDSSNVLLDIINDLLDISKIEAGKLELREDDFSVKELLWNIKTMFASRACRKNLTLKLSYYENPEQPEDRITTDKTRLEQILMNLITNAIKYTEEGSIEISVGSKSLNADKSEFKVAVKDTGIGIDSENIDKLFQKFGQLDQSYTRNSSGTGLGLYICKELAKILGGEIGVISEPGQGSTFWFTFVGKHVVKKNSENHIKCDYENINLGLNVLLVDDKDVNIKVFKLLLESAGCKVDTAFNGEESISAFKPDYHDIIFMDIMMPVMDGITAMRRIRQQNKNVPPIIALTANAMEGDAKTYISKGFTDYLPKPATREDLIEMMVKWATPEYPK
ncbi:MAG: response regulator [Bacteroidetes bacterium]|nr:response regulator [Bacteroidota bacterium]